MKTDIENTESAPGAGSSPSPGSTLGDKLPEEIARCQELLGIYDSLGPVGQFGKAAIKAEIDNAHKAMISGDLPSMIDAYQRLQGCE